MQLIPALKQRNNCLRLSLSRFYASILLYFVCFFVYIDLLLSVVFYTVLCELRLVALDRTVSVHPD